MRTALALAGLAALVLAPAPSAEGADAARPRVALSVSPTRLVLAAPGSRAIKVRNDGAEQVAVDATHVYFTDSLANGSVVKVVK